MRILLIGSGGREHAIAWKFAQSSTPVEVIACPGNPGIASFGRCAAAQTPQEWLAFARNEKVDLTIVGPEAPLVAGVGDVFRAASLPIVGPSSRAARLEGSKIYSKTMMAQAGIPTAKFVAVSTYEDAQRELDAFGFPVVLKADGLAAGKGVVVARDRAEAEVALPKLLETHRVVIEEFLEGREVSFIVLTDGKTAIPLEPCQDHKALLDGDRGPNTGGMGAYCDSSILSGAESEIVMDTIVEPTLQAMHVEEAPFTGFLFVGLMMTAEGPKVLEYNARLGDPETQVILHRLESDFLPVMQAAAAGDLTSVAESVKFRPDPSVCVVLAAHGYPEQVRKGDLITGIAEAEATGATVFQAGTKQVDGSLVTDGGRVLGVTARGSSLQVAIENAYRAVEKIHFDGMQWRSDIGQKGLSYAHRKQTLT